VVAARQARMTSGTLVIKIRADQPADKAMACWPGQDAAWAPA
jgi:hypothetical protein